MSSGLTQSIGVGAANTITVKPGDHLPKQEARGIDPKQVINQTQVSAQAASHTFALKEREKVAPQVPKRVEAPYSPKKKGSHRSTRTNDSDNDESLPKESKLDLTV